jgi:hypothetical protein
LNKSAYIVTVRDFAGYGITKENTIICDEASLITAIKSLISKDEKETSVIVRKCGLMMNDKDSDQYRMGAWGKTSGE